MIFISFKIDWKTLRKRRRWQSFQNTNQPKTPLHTPKHNTQHHQTELAFCSFLFYYTIAEVNVQDLLHQME